MFPTNVQNILTLHKKKLCFFGGVGGTDVVVYYKKVKSGC